jgi:hypothetical protein
LIGQFEVSCTAVDGHGVGAVHDHYIFRAAMNQTGWFVRPHRWLRKQGQREHSQHRNNPLKTAMTQFEHDHENFLSRAVYHSRSDGEESLLRLAFVRPIGFPI